MELVWRLCCGSVFYCCWFPYSPWYNSNWSHALLPRYHAVDHPGTWHFLRQQNPGTLCCHDWSNGRYGLAVTEVPLWYHRGRIIRCSKPCLSFQMYKSREFISVYRKFLFCPTVYLWAYHNMKEHNFSVAVRYIGRQVKCLLDLFVLRLSWVRTTENSTSRRMSLVTVSGAGLYPRRLIRDAQSNSYLPFLLPWLSIVSWPSLPSLVVETG